MVEKNDWRVTDQGTYLNNAKLKKSVYKAPSESWDHDHCAFCWETFAEFDGYTHEGYCTEDENIWICEECYQDFKEMFGFTLVEQHK